MSDGAKQEIQLTLTSYIVLGLLKASGETTPYELKRMAAATVGAISTVSHSQIYKEPKRLARAGYLNEKRERTGRRRTLYSLTKRGDAALAGWLAEPETSTWTIRYPALLKLVFGADPSEVAPAQLDAHRKRLREMESLLSSLELAGASEGAVMVVQLGITHVRQDIRFWSRLAGGKSG